MTTTKFQVPENPTKEDLFVWCDWLEDRGQDTSKLREFINSQDKEHQPYDSSHITGQFPGWEWHLDDAEYCLTSYLPPSIWNALNNYMQDYYPNYFKTYPTRQDAWDALAEALQ